MTDQAKRPPGDRYGVKPRSILRHGVLLAGIAVFALGLWVWFGWRISVGAGQVVVLVKKTGADLENAMVIAPDSDHKGIQIIPLREGRHFYNPFFWDWTSPMRATVVPEGHVGVKIRRYGKALPAGRIAALSDDEKGIVASTLGPGRYYLNSLAYDVEIHPALQIEPGHVGVVTLRAGDPPQNPNAFLVEEGERGVQRKLLPAGTHPINPYIATVTPIDIRSHKFEMSASYSITFPSSDGFDIVVEGTCEWAPREERVPEVFVKYVDSDDLKRSGGIDNIQRKLILPYARSFSRIVGSQHPAVDFISGETRSAFQRQLLDRLRSACEAEGILIKTVVIRNTVPPAAIRAQYQAREIAKRQLDQYLQEIDREKVRIEQKLKELAKSRQTALGDIRKQVAGLMRLAEENREVRLNQANQRLEVAAKKLEAAKNLAAAIRAKGEAEAAVVVMKNTAEANAIKAEVEAFGGGDLFARYKLIRKFAPAIRKILSNTEGPFAELFQSFTKSAPKEGGK